MEHLDWDAIAAAAIEASRESGDAQHERKHTPEGGAWCVKCGADMQLIGLDGSLDRGCRQPVPPTQPEASEAERERCRRLAYVCYHPDTFEDADAQKVRIEAILLSERAAADKAGYERGFKGGQDAVDDAVQAREDLAKQEEYTSKVADRCAAVSSERRELQSKYERLAAAARAYRHDSLSTTGRVAKALDAALEASSLSDSEGEGK